MRAGRAGRCLAGLLCVCALGAGQAAEQGEQVGEHVGDPVQATPVATPPASVRERKPASTSPSAFAQAAAARGRPRVLRETASGLIVSRDGWAIVPAALVRNCASIEAVVDGRARTVVPAADNPSKDFALVQIEGAGFRSLSPRRESMPRDVALTLLGHPAGAGMNAPARVTVAFSSTDERDDLASKGPWITVAPGSRFAHAAVLDDHGRLAGVVQERKGEKPAEARGMVWRVDALRALMKFHGVAWPTVSSKGSARPVAEVLREALPATALVACYREP